MVVHWDGTGVINVMLALRNEHVTSFFLVRVTSIDLGPLVFYRLGARRWIQKRTETRRVR